MPISGSSTIQDFILEAKKEAQRSEWTTAAGLYRQVLGQLDQDTGSPEKAGFAEFVAKCLFNAAFQSGSRIEFKETMKTSGAYYESARRAYQDLGVEASAKRLRSRELFAEFWLQEDIGERREIISRCLALAKEAFEFFEGQGQKRELLETRNDILTYSRESLSLATDWKTRIRVYEAAQQHGRAAIRESESLNDDELLFDSLHLTLWLLAVEAESVLELPKFQRLSDEISRLRTQLSQVSHRIGNSMAISLESEAAGNIAFDAEADYTKAMHHYELGIRAAIETRDSLVAGRLHSAISNAAYWKAIRDEYVNEKRQALGRGLENAFQAVRSLEVPYHTSLLAVTYASVARCQTDLAIISESESEKRKYLESAIKAASQGMQYETGTYGWKRAAHELCKATYILAMVSSPESRAQLLSETLAVREETVRVTDLLFPHFWDRGVMRNYLALIKAELGKLESEQEKKIPLLQAAASDLQQCLDLCAEWSVFPAFMSKIAEFCEGYGDILHQLYLLTHKTETIREEIEAYNKAIHQLTILGGPGLIGPISWKAGKAYDMLGDYDGAIAAFRKSAQDYKLAASKIPGSTSVFEELASYMEAWAEIENAMMQHSEEKYDLSHNNYDKAAEILRTTKNWSGLAMLCDARSLLEKGEALSHEEKHGPAIESLTTALDRFRQARKEFEEMGRTAIDEFARREIEDWTMIAERREAYASGRIELEEARSLDTRGEKVTSSRKYKSASVTFRTLATKIPEAQDRAEMENLAQFCESWAQRKEAESKSSPELFAEAAESFMKAKETATNPNLRLLAMGDASICRALESGTRFRQSRDVQLYSEIKRHLEVATDHYTEAGFKKTGTWTRATQRLFDALMLLAGAEVEREVGKKTELYHVAEKHLVLAAKLYGEAGFPSKKRETLEQLERTREEKEVLLAPLEALAEIPPASATHLPSITLRGAQPFGLERFEDAKVTGELRTPQTDLTMGSDFTVNIDIANVGKTPATLIKLEGMVPGEFEPVEKQGAPSLEGNSLDLKGKRLEYLKTHGVQVSFRPTRKGEFELTPRVVYVDEKGNYKSTNLQPLYLTVREPGISEGLHAPPSVHLPQDFQFENERSRQVFSRLVKEFLDDYMTKRIVMERAGWRSLMDVIRDVKIPRSALYGPGGRTGPVLAELERRGLVETRVFPKERGRGGEIKKVRVAYENTIVRRIVDRAVMENA